MRLIKISNADSKTGDSGNDYLIALYQNNVVDPIKLDKDIDYQIKVGNDTGYLKTINGTIDDDSKGLILSAKELSNLPEDMYYIEVWFEKDGLKYIYPSSGKAKIKLDANIETIKGNVIPTITVDELRKEIANGSTAVKGTKGDKGDKGDVGPQGPQGEKGEPGSTGAQGPAGAEGKSAYQVWVDAGNQGTELDFLNSLKGDKGDTGEQGATGEKGDKGDPGKDGIDGKSAYQIWLDAGNAGTEQDFLNSLKGKDGTDGQQGPQGVQGTQGEQGPKGDTGAQGASGQDGKSAYQVWLDQGNSGTEEDFINSLKGKDADEEQVKSNTDAITALEKTSKESIESVKTDLVNTSKLLNDSDTELKVNFEQLKNQVETLTDRITTMPTQRHAPTGWTLDRSTNPWTIWFDNGCGLQFPEFPTTETVYGYGYSDTYMAPSSTYQTATKLIQWPLIGNVLSASHGTLTLEEVAKITDPRIGEYWADNTKVINPINDDTDNYDWSNVFFSDTTRNSDEPYKPREKNFFRVMYQLGIWSIDDIKPFGLKEKE